MRIRKNHLSGDEGWTENVPSAAHSSGIGGSLDFMPSVASPFLILRGEPDAMKKQMDARFKALRGENVIEPAVRDKAYRDRHRDEILARRRAIYRAKREAA